MKNPYPYSTPLDTLVLSKGWKVMKIYFSGTEKFHYLFHPRDRQIFMQELKNLLSKDRKDSQSSSLFQLSRLSVFVSVQHVPITLRYFITFIALVATLATTL